MLDNIPDDIEMKSSDDSARARLEAIGFHEVGEWRVGNGCLHCDIPKHPASKNVLYAFLCDDEVLYIGKTVSTLRARMRGYERPARTQTTNIRSHGRIAELLNGGRVVKVLALPDNGLLHFGGFHVNLAAGIEDSLVRDLKPKWNLTGAR